MRPSSLGGGRILRRTLSVRLSVCPSVCLSVRPVSGCTLFTVAPSYERTSKIEKLRFSLMGQRHVCTFFGTRRGPHIVRPSRPHKFLFRLNHSIIIEATKMAIECIISRISGCGTSVLKLCSISSS